MNKVEKEKIRIDLMQCQTIGEIFHYISNYFDLFSKNIPGIYKMIIVSGILQAIEWINPNKKYNANF
jgi:hypothetical protein